jgi:hypothetical protein
MPETFADLLQALQGPLAVGVFVWFASWGMEEFAFWQALSGKAKSLIVLGFSVLLGVGSVWFSGHPAWVETAAPYVKAVLAICGAWLGTQVVHRNDGKAKAPRFKRQFQELDEGDESPTED